MIYRSEKAQAIHTALLGYLKTLSEEWFAEFKAAIESADEASLSERGIHGHSHLVDLFHLAKEICPKGVEVASVVFRCFDMMMQKVAQCPQARKALLIIANDDGFTPLHQALVSGQSENMKVYFEGVRQALKDGVLTAAEYKRLLINPNQAGFTPLHEALISGHPANMKVYFEAVRQAIKDGVLTAAEYKHLLINANQAGFTPLHEALISGQPENMNVYFEAVCQAIKDGVLIAAEYKRLLINANQAGFTPLHQALISGQPENMNVYFEAVREAIKDGVLTAAEYKRLLINPNQAGFTPLHEALISGQPENMNVYFEAVCQAIKDGVLIAAEYKRLLLSSNQAGFTPLHDALRSGQSANMNVYFEAVRQAVKDGVLTADEYKHLLQSPNCAGFTPLHQAANSGSLDLVRNFVEILERDLGGKALYELLQRRVKGYVPSCQMRGGKPQATLINQYLSEKRQLLSKVDDTRGHEMVERSRSAAWDDRLAKPSSGHAGDVRYQYRAEQDRYYGGPRGKRFLPRDEGRPSKDEGFRKRPVDAMSASFPAKRSDYPRGNTFFSRKLPRLDVGATGIRQIDGAEPMSP